MVGAAGHTEHLSDSDPNYPPGQAIPVETRKAKRILPELIPLLEDPDAVSFLLLF